ncbi:hypothetical protein [Saccharopolyspora sp. NPDC049426]|uniref:hypothetical protein n=1 Tax=Saccharopolyspora sp. NPDC049426 TaxID=3155652 RepID=UPI00341670C2
MAEPVVDMVHFSPRQRSRDEKGAGVFGEATASAPGETFLAARDYLLRHRED